MKPNPRLFPAKAQSSVEFLVILAIGLGILAIIISSSQQSLLSSQDTVRLAQAQDASRALAQAADEVYSEGPGSRKQVQVTIPEGVNSTTVSNRTINIRVGIQSGFTDENAQTRAIVVGTIPRQAGTYKLWVAARDDGRVQVGNVALSITPATIFATIYPTNFTQKNIAITNLNTSAALSITINLSRPSSTDVSVNWSDTTNTTKNIALGAGANTTLTINISATASALGSYLDGFVYANASNNETLQTDIAIIVSPVTCTSQSCASLSCYTSPACASFCSGSNCPPSCGGAGGNQSNVSFITIETFHDSALAIPRQAFDPATANITINGLGWNSSLNVTLDVRFPNASTIGSPYPKNVSTNASGYFADEVNPAGLPAGTNYTVRANQNGVARLYSFNITSCS